jgi:hypothetical protein
MPETRWFARQLEQGAVLDCARKPLLVGSCLGWWMAVFGTASLLDLLQTWLLVQGLGSAYEANPLAAVVLAQFGWIGLALFKASSVVAVLGLALAIQRWHSQAAVGLLRLGCGVLALVLGHGLLLAGGSAGERAEAAQTAQRRQAVMQQRRQRAHLFSLAAARREQLAARILAGQLTLSQAARQLADYLQEIGSGTSTPLRAYCGEAMSDEACLAVHLLYELGCQLRDRPTLARQHLRQLRAQWAVYGEQLPRFVAWVFVETEKSDSQTVAAQPPAAL